MLDTTTQHKRQCWFASNTRHVSTYQGGPTWNISFEGHTAAQMMDALGKDIAVSPGAACHGDTENASHVLVAMGVPTALSRGAIRFSLGRETTEAEIDTVVEKLKQNLKGK
jgi:cysteine desulfurase